MILHAGGLDFAHWQTQDKRTFSQTFSARGQLFRRRRILHIGNKPLSFHSGELRLPVFPFPTKNLHFSRTERGRAETPPHFSRTERARNGAPGDLMPPLCVFCPEVC